MKHTIKDPDDKVLIIGAGPAGLTLAQILRHQNIPFAIFERAKSVTEKRQGWAVGLMEAIPLLQQYLPDDMGDIRETSANWGAREPDSLGLLDGKTGHAFAKLGGVAYGQPGFFLRANRDLLRGHLAQHLEVSTNKRFASHTEDSTGVTAFFTDGTSARGRILIGADGAYSVVRKQVLGPDALPQLSQNIPMNGECSLARSEYEPLRQLGNSVLFAALPGVFFNIGLVSIEPDRSKGEFYWGVAFQSDNPARDSNWAAEADRQTLYDKCVELTREMPAWLTSIIQKTGPQGMNMPCIKFVEYVPPETLPKGGRVTYVGDAAHTMIPFKGAGANTAVADSCDLGRLIVRAFEDDDDGPGWTGITGVLDEYNAIMLPRGREAVLGSRAAGERADSITGMVEGRVTTHSPVTEKQGNKEIRVE